MLRLPFRNKVWRGAAGEFAGSGSGASMDFQDHRTHSPGDDPRHINWQAYARTGQYSMKLFREEIRPVVDLVLDASPSMFFSPKKEKRTTQLLQFLTASSLADGASRSASTRSPAPPESPSILSPYAPVAGLPTSKP